MRKITELAVIVAALLASSGCIITTRKKYNAALNFAISAGELKGLSDCLEVELSKIGTTLQEKPK